RRTRGASEAASSADRSSSVMGLVYCGPVPKKSSREPPPRSPIWFGPVSNGEFVPRAPSALDAIADRMVHAIAADEAPRLGMSRRAFLASPVGMAAALAVLNELHGCGYRVDRRTARDPD